MFSYRSKKQLYIAVVLTLLVFLIYYGFDITMLSSPVGLYDAIALAAQSGAIGFQLIGILYLVSRLRMAFKDDLPPITCYRGSDCPYTAVKRVQYNGEYFAKFIAIFLSPFIIIEVVNLLIGNTNFRFQVFPLSPNDLFDIVNPVLYDVFNYGVTFTNYFLLGTISWILFSTVSAIRETKNVRYGMYDIVDVYCPDRVGGLSPIKKYLFNILYVLLISVTLLMIGHTPLLTSFITHALGHGLYLPYFRVIAGFCVLSLYSLFGVALTIIGLRRLSSICLEKVEDGIKGINEKYRVLQKKLFALSPDELDIPDREINNLKSIMEIFSNERERLLQWHSHCGGINAGTAIRLFVAYIPPLATIVFQLYQLFSL